MEELTLLKNPYSYFSKNRELKDINYKDFFIKFSIQFFIVILLIILSTLFLGESNHNLVEKLDWKFYLTLPIVPLIEELNFRYFLRPFNINILLLFTSLLFLFLLMIKLFDFISFYSFIYALLAFIIIYKKIDPFNKKSTVDFIERNYNILFYISAIVFSLLHINNGLNGLNDFNFNINTLLGYFFSLSSYFIFAIFVSNIRIKYGFKYCVLFHVLNNLIPALVMIILTSLVIDH